MEGDDNDNGPKQRIRRCLGPRWVNFFYIRDFLILNDIYRYYLCIKGAEGHMEGDNDNDGPKRRIRRHLGPRWVIFFIFVIF